MGMPINIGEKIAILDLSNAQKRDIMIEPNIEALKKEALEKISQLSEKDCADILAMLKERGGL